MSTDRTKPNQEYPYDSEHAAYNSEYLLKPIKNILAELEASHKRIFELGCGNGYNAKLLSNEGYDIVAVDPSNSGITQAQRSASKVQFAVASAYDDLSSSFGTFDVLLSIEVVEHVFYPRIYAKTAFDLLDPGGVAIISTPYYGYLKNLAIALCGKFDSHVNPLWDGGHIKFWSKKTLSELLMEAGFKSVEYRSAGRFPWLAKSMIAIARK